MSPLPHFGRPQLKKDYHDLSGKTSNWEPVWNNLAEVEFPIDLQNDFLSYQLYSIDGDLMYFNLNWDINTKRLIPLETIMKWLNQPMQIGVRFHDVENVTMYRIEYINFKFTEILNPDYFNWGDHTIKDLVVRFEYDLIKIKV